VHQNTLYVENSYRYCHYMHRRYDIESIA